MKKAASKFLVFCLTIFFAFYASPLLADWQKDGKRWANHALNFGLASGENSGIEFLDYRYGDPESFENGDPKIFGLRPSISQLKRGRIKQGVSTSGGLPVGDYLYVKWKDVNSGKIYEDTADLRNNLPEIMDNKRIYFLIKESKLNVYIIFDKEGRSNDKLDCPVRLYNHNKCSRIYPDKWQNF